MGINLALALQALGRNRLQALLTLSGMSCGVAMVVVVSGLGRGAQLRIESQIEAAGPTAIVVRSGNLRPAAIVTSGEQDTSGGEVSEGALPAAGIDGTPEVVGNAAVDDARRRATAVRQTRYRSPPQALDAPAMELVRKRTAGVKLASALVEGNVTVGSGRTTSQRIVKVSGFEADLPEMLAWRLVQGRFPSQREYREAAPVLVVSEAAAAKLWPGRPALQQQLQLGDVSATVIGVLTAQRADNNAGVVPTVHVPLLLAQRVLRRDSYDQIRIRTASVAVTTQVATDLKQALRRLHLLPDDTVDDFRIETQSISAMPSMGMDPRLARSVHSNVIGFEQASWEEMSKSLRQAGRIFTLLLAGAATVSLLVGGIGVMNIMLVSVTARTREIGLRMAMGARRQDVQQQFLVEAITLATVGGSLGLLVGYAALLAARYGLHWSTAVSPLMLLLAIVMAVLTGVAFGYGPARRAAVLDPVVALKTE